MLYIVLLKHIDFDIDKTCGKWKHSWQSKTTIQSVNQENTQSGEWDLLCISIKPLQQKLAMLLNSSLRLEVSIFTEFTCG